MSLYQVTLQHLIVFIAAWHRGHRINVILVLDLSLIKIYTNGLILLLLLGSMSTTLLMLIYKSNKFN